MKKQLRIALSLLVMLVLALSMTACDKKTAEIPEGYVSFDNGDISFAYPSDWTKTEGSVTQLINPAGVGNNITVSYEAKSDLYKKMTVDSFNTTLKPMLETAGMKVSGVKVEQRKNPLGIDATAISYSASMSNVSMSQTMFIVDSGNKNYIVTITEVNADSTLVNNVFNTLNK